jgi:hypothetical protein
VDCLLTWDDKKQAYVLDKISSCFSLRYERKSNKLSAEAKQALALAQKGTRQHDVQMADAHEDDGETEEGELGNDNLAEQLQRDLDARSGHTSPMAAEREIRREPGMSRSNSNTGLGLIYAGGLHEEVITPRGSPFVDRTAKAFPTRSNDLTHSTHMRSTPGMSPVSVANSPRPTGLESSLSSAWRPPAQRANVALTFDEDDDDEEEEEDSDEEEEEEDENEDDDDDLDAFARELEGSLMEPSSAVEEEVEAPATLARTRRASNRNRRT